ncbi:MAG: hypothetical protein IJW70_02040 [Clostridia bacterium]|nr:hypothetical protein [Clostridia bacterium]
MKNFAIPFAPSAFFIARTEKIFDLCLKNTSLVGLRCGMAILRLQLDAGPYGFQQRGGAIPPCFQERGLWMLCIRKTKELYQRYSPLFVFE